MPLIDVDAFNLYDFPNETGSPERNLLLAILERAILDYIGNQHGEATAAQEWIFAGGDDEGSIESFSFPWICQQLNLDTEKVLNIVTNMPKRGENRTAPWYWKESLE